MKQTDSGWGACFLRGISHKTAWRRYELIFIGSADLATQVFQPRYLGAQLRPVDGFSEIMEFKANEMNVGLWIPLNLDRQKFAEWHRAQDEEGVILFDIVAEEEGLANRISKERLAQLFLAPWLPELHEVLMVN